MKRITPLLALIFSLNFAFSQAKQFSLEDKDLKENSQIKAKTNWKGFINDNQKEQITISDWKDILSEYKSEKQPKGYYNQLMDNYSPSNEFSKASNNLTYAGVLIIGGGLLHLLASSELSFSSDGIANYNTKRTMTKLGTAMYSGAGIFVISASFNINSGAVNLK